MCVLSKLQFTRLVIFVLSVIGLSSTAHALESRSWGVESHAGTVWVHHAGVQPIALNPNEQLGAGSTIETGTDGRVILVRGDETIIVSPSTSIALPEQNDTGMATTILQSFGTILLQVEKRASQHFEVETPFLAAVVKGTKFTVTVDQSGAAVHVVEGAVEVIDLDTGDVGMVRPGQTAHTPAAQGVGLTVGGPGATTPARASAPTRPNKPVPAPASSQAANANTPTAPMVMAAVGNVKLDVGAATGGLARAATVSNGSLSAPEADNSNVANSQQTAGRSNNGNGNSSSTAIVATQTSAVAPGLVNNPNANAGGNGNGNSNSSAGSTGNGNSNSSAGSTGNGLAVGLTAATPPGLVNNPNANAGGNGNGNSVAVGQTGTTPPGLVDNPNSNAGGNGNGNSNAGGNGKGNGKA